MNEITDYREVPRDSVVRHEGKLFVVMDHESGYSTFNVLCPLDKIRDYDDDMPKYGYPDYCLLLRYDEIDEFAVDKSGE